MCSMGRSAGIVMISSYNEIRLHCSHLLGLESMCNSDGSYASIPEVTATTSAQYSVAEDRSSGDQAEGEEEKRRRAPDEAGQGRAGSSPHAQ